jgi:uncharacterized protein with von Willebrand factor type A (vWA) domain
MDDSAGFARAAGDRGHVAPHLAGRIVEFMRLARAEHFRVGMQEAADALKVAHAVGMTDQSRLRCGLRTLVCSNAADWSRFDRVFDRYWQRPNRAAVRIEASGQVARLQGREGGAADAGSRPADSPRALSSHERALGAGASARELTTRSDLRLAELNRDTHALEQWIEDLARRLRKRLLRRHRICATGHRIHLRRTVRHNLRYGGLPLRLIFRERRRELPRLVLITDVSRSMNVYSYFFLRFARGILDAFKDADAFVFHTRLVHVADTLRERDSHRLKEKLAWIAAGWGGGTRIGESLQAFNREYARRVVDSRTFVFIVSDGYDTGAPQLLGEQVRRLSERARRLVWLNPLLGQPDYTPVAGGMQAALPHLDVFASAHNLESLMRIERMLVAL